MFNPGLKIGQIIKNADIVGIFKCGNMGGMRRSKTTNTLVIVSDYTKGLYHDKWIGGVLHYTGMGKSGNHDIHWAQNATLAENAKMKEFNDTLFKTKKKSPHIHFRAYNSYILKTTDNTGTGSNYKDMIIYDLALLFSTALPALAHDSLLFKNLGKDVEDGIIRIYTSTDKQIFIAYDKQEDCRPATQKTLEDNCVLRLSTDGCELYGRSWDTEE